MGLVELIRKNANTKVTLASNKQLLPTPHKRKIHRILEGTDPLTNEVWEKFYTSNMAFVGFGLPNCESDIWWLLTHRAYLYYSNENNIGKLINNHIIYYDVINPNIMEKDEIIKIDDHYEFANPQIHFNTKHKQLSGMHVEVRLRVIGPGQKYVDVFRSILKELSNTKSWYPPKGFK